MHFGPIVRCVKTPGVQSDGRLQSTVAMHRLAAMSGEEPSHRQRIRIGLTGLAFVFLLVIIGAAITRWSAEPDSSNSAWAENAVAQPNDPLAEIGAAPGESSAANAASGENTQNAN
jgi:hypothetical protein